MENENGDRELASVLTATQREYLRGDREVSGGAERALRSRIRERVRSAVFDFRYLSDAEYLSDRDLQHIREFKDDSGETVTEPFARLGDEEVNREPRLDPELEQALPELIAFAFRVSPSTIEQTVQTGVERALRRMRPEAEVGDVEIPIEDPEGIIKRVEDLMNDGVALTEREIRVALEKEVRPAEEIAEYVREHGTRERGLPAQVSFSDGFFRSREEAAELFDVEEEEREE